MYLLEDAKVPGHNTIAHFRSSRLKGIVDDLFNQVVLLLKDYGELSCENLFVDFWQWEQPMSEKKLHYFAWHTTYKIAQQDDSQSSGTIFAWDKSGIKI